MFLVTLLAAVPRPVAAQTHDHAAAPVPDAVGPTPVFTQRRYEIQAARASQPIQIDGIISEEAWRRASIA